MSSSEKQKSVLKVAEYLSREFKIKYIDACRYAEEVFGVIDSLVENNNYQTIPDGKKANIAINSVKALKLIAGGTSKRSKKQHAKQSNL